MHRQVCACIYKPPALQHTRWRKAVAQPEHVVIIRSDEAKAYYTQYPGSPRLIASANGSNIRISATCRVDRARHSKRRLFSSSPASLSAYRMLFVCCALWLQMSFLRVAGNSACLEVFLRRRLLLSTRRRRPPRSCVVLEVTTRGCGAFALRPLQRGSTRTREICTRAQNGDGGRRKRAALISLK